MNKIENKKESKALIKIRKFDINKYIHILIIIIGTLFTLLSCLHDNLWFDESYSVAMASHPVNEIWTIGSYDVHPILYYILLRIVAIITNESILAYRIFSVIPLIILAVLGYTHIKKDFGEKTGFIFSFLILFMPITLAYSSEIRMYTWAMLFVFLTSLYGYRIYKSGISNKNWIIFSVFSLASAYTHYYALIAVAIINVLLFLYFLINNIKQRNYEVKYIKYSKNLKKSIISSIIQILIYLPWISVLISQIGTVSQGYWITSVNFLEMFEFQFTGNLGDTIYINKTISYIFAIIMTIYIVYLLIKNWKQSKPGKLALIIYASVIIVTGLISIITPILYARYLLTITGILLFVFAFLISKDKRKWRVNLICIMILIVSFTVNINLIKNNYNEINSKPVEFIENKINSDDIFIISNYSNGVESGFCISVLFKNNKKYFWDTEKWNKQEAYSALNNMIYTYNLEELKDYKGRIWVISENGDDFLNKVIEQLGNDFTEIENAKFKTQYKNCEYAISLIERK